MSRTPFPQERIDAIVLEVEAAQMAAEDAAMREKMAGLRCQSCECRVSASGAGAEHG